MLLTTNPETLQCLANIQEDAERHQKNLLRMFIHLLVNHECELTKETKDSLLATYYQLSDVISAIDGKEVYYA